MYVSSLEPVRAGADADGSDRRETPRSNPRRTRTTPPRIMNRQFSAFKAPVTGETLLEYSCPKIHVRRQASPHPSSTPPVLRRRRQPQVLWVSFGASGLIKKSRSASTPSEVSTKNRGTSCRSLYTRDRRALAALSHGIRGKRGTLAIRCSERQPDARPSESCG